MQTIPEASSTPRAAPALKSARCAGWVSGAVFGAAVAIRLVYFATARGPALDRKSVV